MELEDRKQQYFRGREQAAVKMQRCPFYPLVIYTRSFLIELVPGIINPQTVSMLIHMEDAQEVTQNTAPVCGEMPSFSMFSALPSV